MEPNLTPPRRVWDRGVILSLQSNTVNAPDGEYTVVDELFCHHYTQFYDLNERAAPVVQQSMPEQPPRGETPQCQFVYSTTRVRVSGGLVDLGALLQAAEELKQLSYYWGVFLEHVQWCTGPGTRAVCEDRMHQDRLLWPGCGRSPTQLTEEERAIWDEGVLYLSWGS